MIDQMSLTQQAKAIRDGSLTSTVLTKHYLSTIRKHNPSINAIVQMREESVILDEANQADKEAAHGKFRGPLHGVPITIKDVLHVKGYRLSRGIAEFMGEASLEDATVVERLRNAGAIILGLTNVPELCMAFETENLIYGRTNNPYDQTKSAGGSSGGEAAAIAAGMSPAGLASDASGSVRVPAHFNGICSLKLTQGRVPLTGQFPRERSGLFHHTSNFGVMGRYIDDLEILGQLISGPDHKDPDTVNVPWISNNVNLPMCKAAFLYQTSTVSPSKPVKEALDSIRSILSSSILSTTEEAPPMFEEASEIMWRLFITGGDGAKGWKQLLSSINKHICTPQLEGLIRMSEDVKLNAEQMKIDWENLDRFRYHLARFFRNYDFLITPVHPTTAFPHGNSLNNRHDYDYVFPFSISGSPVVVIRAGFDPDTQLPIGIQIIAAKWQEAKLLVLARFLEKRLQPWTPVFKSSELKKNSI